MPLCRLAVPSLGGEFQVAPLTKTSETKMHLSKWVKGGKARCLAACSILRVMVGIGTLASVSLVL
jgi:hypothetical protein